MSTRMLSPDFTQWIVLCFSKRESSGDNGEYSVHSPGHHNLLPCAEAEPSCDPRLNTQNP